MVFNMWGVLEQKVLLPRVWLGDRTKKLLSEKKPNLHLKKFIINTLIFANNETLNADSAIRNHITVYYILLMSCVC